MAATANNSGPVLLRRPLPPVQKNKEQISGRKLPTKNGQNFRGAKGDLIHATKSLERHSTSQKTAEILRQNDKVKVRNLAKCIVPSDFILGVKAQTKKFT